jgi:uncharacterized protein (TIRG00374 family)
VRLIFVAGVFVLIFRTADMEFATLTQELQQVHWGYVLLGFGLWLTALFAASVRWKVLLDVVKTGQPVTPLFAFNLVGIFYAQFLPGLVGGELAKGYYLARDGDEKIKVVSSALVDRLLGITVNGLIGLLALIASPLVLATLELGEQTPLWALLVVVVALVTAYAIVRLVERIEHLFPAPLTAVYEPVKLYAAHPVALGTAAVLSIAYFATWALSIWAMAAAAELASLGYMTMLLLLAVTNVAQFLPLSINGAGVREGAIVLILSAYGVPQEQALAFALLIPLTAFGLAALGGLVVLLDYRPNTA